MGFLDDLASMGDKLKKIGSGETSVEELFDEGLASVGLAVVPGGPADAVRKSASHLSVVPAPKTDPAPAPSPPPTS
jgi:hypothetical protein